MSGVRRRFEGMSVDIPRLDGTLSVVHDYTPSGDQPGLMQAAIGLDAISVMLPDCPFW